MLRYVGKRLLLMIPTIFGVLTLTFIVIQLVPGGPVDQLVAEMRAASLGEGARSGSSSKQRDSILIFYYFVLLFFAYG